MDEENRIVIANSMDKVIYSFTESRPITRVCNHSQRWIGDHNTFRKGKNSTVKSVNRIGTELVRFVSRTPHIKGDHTLILSNSLKCQCAKKSLLNTIVSAFTTPRHLLIRMLIFGIQLFVLQKLFSL